MSGWSLGDHERLRAAVARLGLAAPAPAPKAAAKPAAAKKPAAKTNA